MTITARTLFVHSLFLSLLRHKAAHAEVTERNAGRGATSGGFGKQTVTMEDIGDGTIEEMSLQIFPYNSQ